MCRIAPCLENIYFKTKTNDNHLQIKNTQVNKSKVKSGIVLKQYVFIFQFCRQVACFLKELPAVKTARKHAREIWDTGILYMYLLKNDI